MRSKINTLPLTMEIASTTAEMNSGGHSGYFDCYPDTIPLELIAAIMEVGYNAIANNYQKALTDGEKDDWIETDNAYYDFSPSLCQCLQEYVENNKDVIFKTKSIG